MMQFGEEDELNALKFLKSGKIDYINGRIECHIVKEVFGTCRNCVLTSGRDGYCKLDFFKEETREVVIRKHPEKCI
jgi:hypothetical protein